MVASLLTPASGGDLGQSVDRLQARYPRLLAVAVQNDAGEVLEVYPWHPRARAAVAAVRRDGAVTSVPAATGTSGLSVVAAVVSLNRDDSPAARQVLVVFAVAHPPDGYWLGVSCTACLVTIVVVMAGVRLRARCRAQVETPLRAIERLMNAPSDEDTASRGESWPFADFRRLADGILALRADLAAERVRVTRVEEAMTRELQRHRLGFDRQLRLARDRATLDPVTGLRNRAFLESELDGLFDMAVKTGRGLIAVMIDLDNFKHYNDEHGHHAGDMLLQFVGKLYRGNIRPRDHAVRYGGDEFLLLLPGTAEAEGIRVAERLVKMFTQYARQLSGSRSLSMSAGVASVRETEPRSGRELITQADMALYAAKRAGKNCVHTYQPDRVLHEVSAEPAGQSRKG